MALGKFLITKFLSIFFPHRLKHAQVYKVILEIVFKLMPTVLIAYFNVRIMIVYRQTCNKRRRMTLSHTKDDDSRKFAEERRLMFLLGKIIIKKIEIYWNSIILHRKYLASVFNLRFSHGDSPCDVIRQESLQVFVSGNLQHTGRIY